MSNTTLKTFAQRGALFGSAAALVVAAIAPAVSVFADALNPLTDRSLTLSSSSPGWDFTDGSGYSTSNNNPAGPPDTYAPPNSGANGQKTGNTFAFKVSTTTTTDLKAMTFQYCTTSAGDCMGPGDNLAASGTVGDGDIVRKTNAQSLTDNDKRSDLEVVLDGDQSEIGSGAFGTYVDTTASSGVALTIPARTSTGTNYMVYYRTSDNSTPNNPNDDDWAQSTGWSMSRQVAQTGTEGVGTSTAKNNQITLTHAGAGFTAGTLVKVVFFATDTNYITNPGSGAFFVKINTWSHATNRAETDNIDGGVTVANVMNQSIHITTKVLETMQFSVGTVDPATLDATDPDGAGPLTSQLFKAKGTDSHGVCDPVVRGMDANTPSLANNTLQLGNSVGEFSLEVDKTYSTHSYWRLSSNSSAGATVYYSGVSLSNTVGDVITPIGPTKATPTAGMEQFGLAIASNNTVDNIPRAGVSSHSVNYTVERGANGAQAYADQNLENGADNATNGVHATTTSQVGANPSYHAPRLFPLIPGTNYNQGAGVVNANYGLVSPATSTIDTAFAFDPTSNDVPVAIATEDSEVVDCVTAKMRYIANIAATTPAGIYTTKINYIAAPQY